MILCNGWNGSPENVLIERTYFGSRTSPGGPPVHFSDDSNPSINCWARDCYYDGTVASVGPTSINCGFTNTHPRSEWTHGDPWNTY
jgi:hypothetical protein